jgi:hypothetical protein
MQIYAVFGSDFDANAQHDETDPERKEHFAYYVDQLTDMLINQAA